MKALTTRNSTRQERNGASSEEAPETQENSNEKKGKKREKNREKRRFGANARLEERHESGVTDKVLQKNNAGKGAERTEASGRRGQRNICAARGQHNRTAV